MTEKSAVAEHARENHCPINWEETSVLDTARGQGEVLLNEALHIQMTTAEEHFSRDRGLENPGLLDRIDEETEAGDSPHQPLTSVDIQ